MLKLEDYVLRSIHHHIDAGIEAETRCLQGAGRHTELPFCKAYWTG